MIFFRYNTSFFNKNQDFFSKLIILVYIFYFLFFCIFSKISV
ncbi:hypothetical protein HMPREF1500_2466 [Fusobacterium sp. CM22]|uniref:Uncharacterized protein n=1 Tax=Fusobacterium polymorphum ATCC 10953 TaxID=393480 RepID=A5TVS7_FUSNP|nr:hypothetical protein FNP_1216 [Fusobacterium polymorphum ATCC 10953]EUB14745.1 hypothetical protein HMPREF1500_2466 [Fusobacterium sp. CM22]EUB36215.1 hypothetical protein HMPREF1501_0428 [Fusobacterium sp. OBRC1]